MDSIIQMVNKMTKKINSLNLLGLFFALSFFSMADPIYIIHIINGIINPNPNTLSPAKLIIGFNSSNATTDIKNDTMNKEKKISNALLGLS